MNAPGRGMVQALADRTPMGLKTRLAAAACTRPVGRFVAAVTRNRIRNNGLIFDTTDAVYDPHVKALLFWNQYERAELRFIAEVVDNRFDVVELGASLGITGAHAVHRLHAGRRYVAVEANPSLLPVLEANLRTHAAGAEWAVVHAAITQESGGTVEFEAGAMSYASKIAVKGAKATLEVPRLALRDLIAQQGLDEYMLISDIEGAEAAFILGDPSALEGCRQMVIELHAGFADGKSVTTDDLKRHLVEVHRFDLVDERGPVLALKR